MANAEQVERAVHMVNLANKHAFTCEHPAYKTAEELLGSFSGEERALVQTSTGGLKAVIGRGLTGYEQD